MVWWSLPGTGEMEGLVDLDGKSELETSIRFIPPTALPSVPQMVTLDDINDIYV